MKCTCKSSKSYNASKTCFVPWTIWTDNLCNKEIYLVIKVTNLNTFQSQHTCSAIYTAFWQRGHCGVPPQREDMSKKTCCEAR